MAVVVSDTSPIRALAHIELLHVLRAMFGEVHVPPAVARELSQPPGPFQGVDVAALAWITIRPPGDQERVRKLQEELDLGEAEALALAEEIHADAVLMDEAAGRNVASRLGLPVIGTLGILLRARQRGMCQELRPLLDKLQGQLRFYIAPALREKILREAGESSEA